MTVVARRIIRWVLFMVCVYLALMTGLIVWVVWSLMIDVDPPLTNMRGTLLSYDAETRVARIQWDATRNRFCPGRTVPKLMDGIVVTLEEGLITGAGTSEDRRMQQMHPGEMGYPVTWTREVVIPPGVTGTARYVIAYYYECNTLQSMRPLIVLAPEVEIPVGDDAGLTAIDPAEPGRG